MDFQSLIAQLAGTLGPSSAMAQEPTPPEEIARRKSIMGDLSGLTALPQSVGGAIGREDRLKALLADAVKRGDIEQAALLRKQLLETAASPF